MSTPALYNIKTLTGLQDCLVLQVIDSLGNVISGNNYVVRGAIALKGETYDLTVTQDALGDYLLTWGNLPAGVWRYDIFVNEEPLLYGNAIVQGRVTPCVTENTQDLGQFLQVQTDQEGVVKITLSDVNSAKWYAEVAKGSADEAKNVLQETENLSLDIERQIEAGKTEISETTESSISSINTAENTAIANIDTEKENALDDLSQEVTKAQNYATSAQNSATQSATSAANAQESENKAKEAQTATETLADELDEKYERAVFADNSGNVDIEGGLTVDGTANLNGGAIVPEPTTNENPQTFGLARSHEAIVRPAIQSWFSTQTNLTSLYEGKSEVRIFDYELPELITGNRMFYQAVNTDVRSEFPKLQYGVYMFSEAMKRVYYEKDFPELINSNNMFRGAYILGYKGKFPKSTNVTDMFRGCWATEIIITEPPLSTRLSTLIYWCTRLRVFRMDMSNVVGLSYFAECTSLEDLSWNLQNVEEANNAFYSEHGYTSSGATPPSVFSSALPKLKVANQMFGLRYHLTTLKYPIDENGQSIYESGLPQDGESYSYLTLPSLTNGKNIFRLTKLDKPSAISVLNSLQQSFPLTSDGAWQFGIGINKEYEEDSDVLQSIENARAKGWTVDVQWT